MVDLCSTMNIHQFLIQGSSYQRPMAMQMVSLLMHSLGQTGGALNHAPDSFAETWRGRALDFTSLDLKQEYFPNLNSRGILSLLLMRSRGNGRRLLQANTPERKQPLVQNKRSWKNKLWSKGEQDRRIHQLKRRRQAEQGEQHSWCLAH